MKRLSDGFKQHMKITDAEERLFDYVYKRERNLKIIISILIAAIIVLSVLRL